MSQKGHFGPKKGSQKGPQNGPFWGSWSEAHLSIKVTPPRIMEESGLLGPWIQGSQKGPFWDHLLEGILTEMEPKWPQKGPILGLLEPGSQILDKGVSTTVYGGI